MHRTILTEITGTYLTKQNNAFCSVDFMMLFIRKVLVVPGQSQSDFFSSKGIVELDASKRNETQLAT